MNPTDTRSTRSTGSTGSTGPGGTGSRAATRLTSHEPLPPRPAPAARYVRETALLVGRGLRTVRRVPERLSDVTIQPVIFTLLFTYVFGSAIHIPGIRYQDYLLPGLIAQTIAFGVIGAGTAASTDFNSGVIDRFKSLPVTRLAVITAQIVGQFLEQIIGLLIVVGIGLAVGWRPDLGVGSGLELVGLIALGLFAFTTFGVLVGMLVKSSEAFQGIGFAIVLPLSFLAGTFVPIAGMTPVLRTIGEYDPLSAIVAALRQITQGTDSAGSWPLEHPVPAMIIYSVAIIAVCLPLAVRNFRASD